MTAVVSSREAWLKARIDLLAEEKAFSKARDALAAKRRALPQYRIDKPYMFETIDGSRSLASLFGSRSQLIVYHFMFAPNWEQGCKSCSFWADTFNGITTHLNQRDVAFVCVSSAPLDKLLAFRKRMGWQFDWVSSAGTDFNSDFGVTGQPGKTLLYNFDKSIADAGELPGISVFARNESGEVFHTYSCYARGLDMMNATYQYLDLVPKGRDEASLPYTMSWVKLHDLYETSREATRAMNA
jgi:predicted dithiol-disulfide oxidoreductase (DUF899 family)